MDLLAALCNASDPSNVEISPSTKTGSRESLKKMHKRAANRKSAQLSRKRKKEYIEELQDQNNDLKKRVHILRHVPDLVVVFNVEGVAMPPSDSMDRVLPKPNSIDFASDAALKLLQTTPKDMEGRSIWEYFSPSSRNSLQLGLKSVLSSFTPQLPPPAPSKAKKPRRMDAKAQSMNQLQQLEQLKEDGVQGGKFKDTVTSIPLPEVYSLELVSPTNPSSDMKRVKVQGVCSFTPGELPQCILSIRNTPSTPRSAAKIPTKIPTSSNASIVSTSISTTSSYSSYSSSSSSTGILPQLPTTAASVSTSSSSSTGILPQLPTSAASVSTASNNSSDSDEG